jgi:hypothetical protein
VNAPPAQRLNRGRLARQVAPPSNETLATLPPAPPLDHRSCCHTAIMPVV